MKPGNIGAQKYFDSVPKEWDALYSHENRFMYTLNHYLRKGLYQRYRLTFENCGDLTGATVLDIGCGTGRYSIECAKKGARRVIGIDFAPSMIDFARQMAQENNCADKCEFICGDFLAHQFDESFDVVLALGFFDYIRDPEPFFKKIASFDPRRFIASFPNYPFLSAVLRRIRYYWIRKCPIYDYPAPRLQQLYRQTAFPHSRIIPCTHGFVGVAGTEETDLSVK